MTHLIAQGVPPAVAAREASELAAMTTDQKKSAQLADPLQWANAIVEASAEHDDRLVRKLLALVVRSLGVGAAWDTYVEPVMQAVREAKHTEFLSERNVDLVRDAVIALLRPMLPDEDQAHHPVLLVPLHRPSLELVALQAALNQRDVAAHRFRGRLSPSSLGAAVAYTGATVVYAVGSDNAPLDSRLVKALEILAAKTTLMFNDQAGKAAQIPRAHAYSGVVRSTLAVEATLSRFSRF